MSALLLRRGGHWLALACLCLPLGTASPTLAQAVRVTETQPPVQVVRRTDEIRLDGRLDEAQWREAPASTAFQQRDPVQGAAATERTEVRLLYDEDALYIGARLFDSAPDSIVARLGRRDVELEADRFGVFIDPYYDRRTGYYFGVNAAGTLYDGVLMNDDWDDDSWDGVWEGRAARDEEGWTVEMRIPYSQLRFYQQEQYTWGINFRRDIARKNEQDFLVYTPRNESGFVSRFPALHGIAGIRPRRQIEVTPFLTTRAEFTDSEAGDPFNDGSRYVPNAGADFKMALTSNLTLNATINPDFGQVEVDPAVVNLSDNETFFPEKRPFFIEGASVFNFGRGGSNNNWSFNWGNPNFFYTRRIGRSPQGRMPSHDYAAKAEAARILGAAKLTGQVAGSWNVGTVQALTGRTSVALETAEVRHDAEVEPMTYYGVFRAQRAFNDRRQSVGFMSTITARHFDAQRLRDEINSEAFTGGVDAWTFLDRDKTWVLTGWWGLSHLRGSQARITALQQNFSHRFQRPDFRYASLDTTATSLTGTSGRMMLNKQRGRFTVNTALGYISPGFDVNDLGFMWQTNVINAHVASTYRWTEPTQWYRRIFINLAAFRSYDFDGNVTWTGLWNGSFYMLPNYWTLWYNVAYNPETVNTNRTRGGPLTLNPPGLETRVEASTDDRKAWVFEVEASRYKRDESQSVSLELEVEWKPAANLSVEFGPEIAWNEEFAQYVQAVEDPLAAATFGRRYIFANLDQTSVSANIRLNWTFRPGLSLQLFAQPLITSGDFFNYKELARAKSYEFLTYGDGASTYDAQTHVADPDGSGPAAEIALRNPDFNFRALRGTAVLRWEYRPGSLLYLVWTQSRDDSENLGQFRFRDSVASLFEARPENIFMIKLTYWLSR